MNKTIMVVEDQPINQEILKKLLSKSYDVVCADNGREALDILNEKYKDISAILLDIVMPVMDGYQFLEEFGKHDEYKMIPVIVTTEKEGGKDEEKVLNLGAKDFITKPYNTKVLLRRLENLIDLEKTIAILKDAERDTLTQMYNRKAFYRKVREILDNKPEEEFEIIVVDVEKFKVFNETFGWEEGDNLLKLVGKKLKELFADMEGVCAHGHADIFYCFSREKDNIIEKLDKIEKILGERYIERKPTFKYGIYKVEDKSILVNTMCDNAKIAANQIKGLYNQKQRVYDNAVRKRLMLDQIITSSMKSGLAEGQFQLFYQPKYEISSGKMIGAEALVRWNHPELGFMPPDKFIPVFETSGFITELDYFVWENVCRLLSDLKKKYGTALPISVNVSRKDIYKEGTPELLKELVEKYDIPPSYLHLEITETAYTQNTKQLLGVTKKLKEYGFVIEMDDFGRGYSSLNILAELPIDIIKMDMKFIQNERNNKNTHNIISSIVNLAKWMNLMVVVEGVETTEQIEYLKNVKCDFAQGYFYEIPVTEKQFEKIIANEETVPIYDLKTYTKYLASRNSIAEGDKEIILVAEPLGMNREIIRDSLKERFQIVEVEDGNQALEKLREEYVQISAVVADVNLPDIDGYTLLQRIKDNTETKNVPVIITSAQIENTSKQKAYDMGADGFLYKPFEKKEFYQLVCSIIENYKREVLKNLREAENKAVLDGMTGLYNRVGFERKVKEFFEANPDGEATFLMIDIDNFKGVNDSLGHIIGDQAIVNVAEVLKSSFRSNDAICRFGGDEFAVFLTMGLRNHDLNARMTRLCDKLKVSVGEMKVTCSIGICQCPEFGKDYETLYKNADMALMAAKRLGKNQFQVFGDDFSMPIGINSRNMSWILNESNDAVYVCGAEDYELLYMNERASNEMVGKDKNKSQSKKCYEVLWGKDTPCAQCILSEEAKRGSSSTVEAYHEKSGRHYSVRVKTINWSGKDAQIHWAQDVTETVKYKERYNNASEALFAIIEEQNMFYWFYDIDKNTCVNSDLSVRELGTPKFMVNYPESVLEDDIIPEDEADEFRKMHEQLKNGAKHVSMIGYSYNSEHVRKKAKISYYVLNGEDGNKALGIVRFLEE